ncbi:DoxX family protein [Pedobacter insulae]|uniref:Putative oxidoreductase n=1 Tax=Pedobacter insulae TaxID=414048 RepID=A0A1I2UTK8_9SPHI|nr:DoxX family protein [Pedobacter insulae]SFG80388.1 putative oxidoreductase [Pedobacter insulae]
MIKNLPILRTGLIVIFLAHSLSGMFNNGVNDFGNLYLNQIGFAPFGVILAWLIKLSHVGFVFSLVTDRYLKFTSIVTILVLVAGIMMVHLKEGWFVVGGGRNGVEFNFLLIICILTILYPKIRNKAIADVTNQ